MTDIMVNDPEAFSEEFEEFQEACASVEFIDDSFSEIGFGQ